MGKSAWRPPSGGGAISMGAAERPWPPIRRTQRAYGAVPSRFCGARATVAQKARHATEKRSYPFDCVTGFFLPS